MPGVSRVGLDTVGGAIINETAQSTVTLEGYLIAVEGAKVMSHGSGTHASAVINEGSSTVTIGGKKVIRGGDKATCLHPATGSTKLICG